jgi:pyruvate/2-oxoglutarate dehydrogenase complex dihydrolipoamide acyltransferase (E2) component
MTQVYSPLPTSPFFRIADGLNRENKGDNKVAMLSEVDMSSANNLREQVRDATGVKPSYTALVAKAVALAYRRHPHANRIPVGFFRQRIVQLHTVDVSVAVERDLPGVEQAVFVGTIRNTDTKDLATITRELIELRDATPETNTRWRTFKWIVEKLPSRLALWLTSLPRWWPSMWVEHRGGASLISSPAKYGVDMMIAAWPWPMGFSFGLVKDRPIAINGVVVIRPTMFFTMSFDRRMMGGAPAARFFATVCEYLQNADRWLIKSGDQISVSDEYEGDIFEKRRLSKPVLATQTSS